MNAWAVLIPALFLGALAAAYWPDFTTWFTRKFRKGHRR